MIEPQLGVDDVPRRIAGAGADARASGRRIVGGRDLPVAIGVGLGLAALFIGTLFWHPVAFLVVVLGLATLASIEVGRVLVANGRTVVVPVLILASTTMIVGAYLQGPAGQALGLVVLLFGAGGWSLAQRDREAVTTRLGLTALFGLWIGLLASYAVLLLGLTDGPIVVLAVIGAAALTDVGGFAVGVTLGRRKIAPSVSPNKTWEGLVGGLAFAVVVAVIVLPRLTDRFSVLLAAAVAICCGFASFFGDLVESMIKRDLGLKDFGDVLPGHGGILDRVDGILVALPVGYYALMLAS